MVLKQSTCSKVNRLPPEVMHVEVMLFRLVITLAHLRPHEQSQFQWVKTSMTSSR